MKKGISLIVLVITIIVMIIIAGAIIISLNGTNVINRADEAVDKADLANLRSALTLEYAEIMALNYDADATNDVVATSDKLAEGVTATATNVAQTRYQAVLDTFAALKTAGYTVTANPDLRFTLNDPPAATPAT